MPVELQIPDGVPIRRWEDGTFRVGESRLLVWLVLEGYKNGKSVKRLAGDYGKEDRVIQQVIDYYHSHQDQIERYLEQERLDSARLNIELGKRGLVANWEQVKDVFHAEVSKDEKRRALAKNTP